MFQDKINISLSGVSKCGIVVCNGRKHLNSKSDNFDTDWKHKFPIKQ